MLGGIVGLEREQGVRVSGKTRASGGREEGTLLSSFALTTCLASFPSAQHRGGRFLGGNREGPYRLVPR